MRSTTKSARTALIRHVVATLVLVGCGPAEPACPSSSAEALESCVAACESGDAEACARVGVAYESGAADGAGPNIEAARRYFDRACELAADDQRRLCVLSPSIAPPDDETSVSALERLCEEGEILACHELVRSRLAVQTRIPLELPGAEAEEAPHVTITVGVLADGSVTLDGAPSSVEAIRSMNPEPGTRAVIAADRAVSHARYMEIIDALRAVGITRYAINVNPPAADPAGPE